jgi:hypothetical protein
MSDALVYWGVICPHCRVWIPIVPEARPGEIAPKLAGAATCPGCSHEFRLDELAPTLAMVDVPPAGGI